MSRFSSVRTGFSVGLVCFILTIAAGCNPVSEPTSTAAIPSPSPVTPRILSIYPSEAAMPGASISLVGTDFGEAEGEVIFGDTPSTVMRWGAAQVDVEVPRELASGQTTIKVITIGIEGAAGDSDQQIF